MIQGYHIIERLQDRGHSVVYRALRNADQRPVVLKVLNHQYPTPRWLARYRQEYDIISSLSTPGVVQAYSLEKLGNTTAMVLEDFGGSSLDLLFGAQRPTIEQLLELAIQATAALGQIHLQGIIHKDINPSNMVWNPHTGQLKLIDFGLATRLSSESPTLKDPSIIEGTLPYISPEQTGRMNRRLDYRTDFYSLGVTLYELATGHLPFARADALALVHCHIAAQPRPPIELREDMPPMLSRIIMKLLAKTAEDRYQSARGLAADLERCRAQLLPGQEADTFPLAREDASDRFVIPQKLYGRAHETRVLLDAFERIAQGRRACLLVTGYSGIGKSSLVRELYKPITRQNAFFASGKFDQLQRATPYGSLAAACAELVKQLLTRGGDELLGWQEELVAALGPNGRLLIDLIPELELVIGPQPPVEELGPTEAQHRMTFAFCSFLRVFCKPAHPLVIFLDDLQWVDAATLRLLEPMTSNEDISHFLLIGAYRDNEVDAAHPLAAVLQDIADRGTLIGEIHLQPLGLEDMMQILADTLHHTLASVRSLAQLVLRRTGGNPFFINEFLRTLHEEGLLRFDASAPGWRWDLARIDAIPVTDSVAELLSPKLRKLAEDTQALLRLAACVGNRFDLETIAIIAERTPALAAEALMPAVREGYILPAAEPEVMAADTQEPQILIPAYRFVHDRVQQAAYALIPEERRAAIHLDIGRLLLARLRPEERDERLFELVDHLNMGRALLDATAGPDALTPVALARLNLTAGIRAREATAYAAAARYLATGLELAGHAWEEHDELALALHVEGAVVEYCHGDYERSQALISVALGRTKSVAIQGRLYQLLLVEHTNQARYEDAFRVAREAMQLLDQPLPEAHELEAALAADLAGIRQLLGDRPIESLIDAPEVSDEAYRAAIGILADLAPPAYQVDAALYPIIIARMVRLTLEHGHSVASVLGYAAYGLMLGAMFDDHQRGYEFGALALRLADRFHSAAAKAKAGQMMSGHIYAWTKPLKGFLPISTAGFEAGLQSGELQYAAYGLLTRMVNYFRQGMSLDRILDEARSFSQFTRRNKNTVVTSVMEGYRIVAAHLIGDHQPAASPADTAAASPAGLLDHIPAMRADGDYIAQCRQQNAFLALGCYFSAKCLALYLEQDYEAALAAAVEARALTGNVVGMICVAEAVFYHSLCLTALYPHGSPAQQRERWQDLEANQARLKVWMESCPENFRHMYLLVAAEMARITDDRLAAMDLYTQAVEAAETSELRQDIAVANELTARFFLALGQTRYAMLLMRDAHYSYALWGARRKLAMLEAQHGQLFIHSWDGSPRPGDAREARPRTPPGTGTGASTSEQLDLASVIKASQALSSEISLDKLLAQLISIVIESAGAQHGYLILQRRDRLAIEARGTLGEGAVEVLRSLPLEARGEGPSLVSTAIVHYVFRSRETVVLHDAVHEGPFVMDPHVVATRPRSILCMPLLHQGKVIGVVYLENKLSPQAFTPERVELLALLSSQMATSLDNSFLYSNLQQASQDLERLLYSIAHDLKEPLRAVQSFSELLVRRHGAEVGGQARDYLARIASAGHHLRHRLDAIHTISEIRRIDGMKQPIPGESLIQGAVQRLRPLIDQTRATVHTSKKLPRFAVDERWASEAIYQILHNALLYTREGLAPEIDIEPYDGSEGVGLVIKDRGPGIPAEHAERMFGLFRRGVGREVPGMGAGLAIARQIAAKHGGNAWLAPRPGGGTEVYITFGR